MGSYFIPGPLAPPRGKIGTEEIQHRDTQRETSPRPSAGLIYIDDDDNDDDDNKRREMQASTGCKMWLHRLFRRLLQSRYLDPTNLGPSLLSLLGNVGMYVSDYLDFT